MKNLMNIFDENELLAQFETASKTVSSASIKQAAQAYRHSGSSVHAHRAMKAVAKSAVDNSVTETHASRFGVLQITITRYA